MATARGKTEAKPKRAKKPADWLPVAGYEGLYEVSSCGSIRSLPRKTRTGLLGGRTLKPQIQKNGYHRVTLSRDGKSARLLVHRIVLCAFRGPCPAGQEARHLNGNAADNRVVNLAWGTRSENAFDRVRHGTLPNNSGERHPNTNLTDEQALEIISRREAGETARSIARAIGTSEQTVGRIANRKGWLHLEGARG